MSLIKHNKFIQVVYIFLLMAMFITLAWYVNYTYEDYSVTTKSHADTLSTAQISPQQKPDSTNEKPFIISKKAGFTTAGISKTLSWKNEDLDSDLQKFWEAFYNNEKMQSMENVIEYDRVYIVYDKYDQNSETFRATIGYSVNPESIKKSQFKIATVFPGKYAEFNNGNGKNIIATIWSNTLIKEDEYLFNSDFEVYQFDSDGEVTAGKIAVGIK